MCMQFTRTPPHMDVGGALRVVGNWHNRIHETSWASGRWVRRGTRLTVQFRYKEPTTFYPMKILEWDPQQRVYACDTAYMLPMRPSKDFWDYMRRRHRPPQRPVPGLLLALPPPPPPAPLPAVAPVTAGASASSGAAPADEVLVQHSQLTPAELEWAFLHQAFVEPA